MLKQKNKKECDAVSNLQPSSSFHAAGGGATI
jgi:hypothetical protein